MSHVSKPGENTFFALVLLDCKNDDKSRCQKENKGLGYIHLFLHWWMNWDGYRYDDLVWFELWRHREACAAQGTLINVTLDVNPVPTTRHLDDRSCERFETDWTLVVHCTKYFVNKTLEPWHCLTLVANEFSFEIRSVNLHGHVQRSETSTPGTHHGLQEVQGVLQGRESL